MIKEIILLIFFILFLVGLFNLYKPLPKGLNLDGTLYSVPSSSISFLEDITYVDDQQNRHSEQEIFDEIFNMINKAEHYILLDMFLYNDLLGKMTENQKQSLIPKQR